MHNGTYVWETRVLHSLMYLLVLPLKPTELPPTVLPIYVPLWSEILHFKYYMTVMSVRITRKRSSDLILLDNQKPVPHNEKNFKVYLCIERIPSAV